MTGSASAFPERIAEDLEALGRLPSLSPVVAQLNATLARDDVGVGEIEAISADAVCAGDPVVDLEEGGAVEADASFTGLGFEAEARTALVDEARDRALRGAASIAGLL